MTITRKLDAPAADGTPATLANTGASTVTATGGSSVVWQGGELIYTGVSGTPAITRFPLAAAANEAQVVGVLHVITLPTSGVPTVMSLRWSGGQVDQFAINASGAFVHYDFANSIILMGANGTIQAGHSYVVQVDVVGVSTTAGDVQLVLTDVATGVPLTLAIPHIANANMSTNQLTHVQLGATSFAVNWSFGWKQLGYNDGPGDQLDLATSLTPQSVGDAIGITDSVTFTVERSITINDVVGITDPFLSADEVSAVDIADAVGITDLVTTVKGQGSSSADDVGITDTVAWVVTRAVLIQDNIGATDSVANPMARTATLADTVGISDVVVAPKSAAGETNSADLVGIIDVVVTAMSRAVLIQDTVGVADTAAAGSNRAPAVVIDQIGITDYVTTVITHPDDSGGSLPSMGIGQNRQLLQGIANMWRDTVSGNPEAADDPSPGGAEVTGISPTSFAGSAGTTLLVSGTGFLKNFHEITINGVTWPTTFLSSTSLQAVIPAAALAAGAKTVRVYGAEAQRTLTVS